MSDGAHTLTLTRHNPVNAYTMATIIKGSGLTVEEFRKLL